MPYIPNYIIPYFRHAVKYFFHGYFYFTSGCYRNSVAVTMRKYLAIYLAIQAGRQFSQ